MAKKNPSNAWGTSWWLLPDSNWGHAALQAAALPTELKSRTVGLNLSYCTDVTGVFQVGTVM